MYFFRQLHKVALQNIADKIFQHFITTKPTGQGKGLGFSYDKARKGEIKVESKYCEGTNLIIKLSV